MNTAGDERVVHRGLIEALTLRAASARRRGGHATAAAALELAAELSDDENSRARWLSAAANDARMAGQPDHARLLVQSATRSSGCPLWSPADTAEGARAEMLTGDPEEALRILTSLVAGAGAAEVRPLLMRTAVAALLLDDAETALAAIRRLEAGGGEAGGGPLAGELLGGLAALRLHLPVDRPSMIRAASVTTGPPELTMLAGSALSLTGEHDDALARLGAAVGDIRAQGALGLLPSALVLLARAQTRAGQVRAACATAGEAAELSLIVSGSYWHYRSLVTLANGQAILGLDQHCRATVARAVAVRRGDGGNPLDALDALCLLELSRRRYDEAVTAWVTDGGVADEGERPSARPVAPAGLREAWARCRRTETADRQIIEMLERDDGDPRTADAWRLRGLIGAENDYARFFEQALRLDEQSRYAFGTARTHLAYGERLRRSGRRMRARRHLTAALEIFETIGAAGWAGLAHQEVAATGRAAGGSPDDLAGLTAQELHVAFAVATGATNREAAASLFLSPKTVEFHLGNVYRKLGIRSRAHLAHRLHGRVSSDQLPGAGIGTAIARS